MTFGNLFKQLRKELGMTQIEFSDQLKLSQSALSKIEHDKLDPTLDIFLKAKCIAFKHKTVSLSEFERIWDGAERTAQKVRTT